MSKVTFITGAGSGIGAGTARAAVVEACLFRTNLLDHRNVCCAKNLIADHAGEGSTAEMWSPYHGTQPGNPAKLGEVLVKIVAMENPPQLFVAGNDALAMITPAVEARGQATRAYEELSRSTDGTF